MQPMIPWLLWTTKNNAQPWIVCKEGTRVPLIAHKVVIECKAETGANARYHLLKIYGEPIVTEGTITFKEPI